MVMKVNKINPVLFKGSEYVTKPNSNKPENDQIKELSQVTPDFSVKTPQKYTKLGETELYNGLKLHSYKLANGHRVSIIPMEDSPTIVKNYVNVGSMNETDDIKGISHFLEHMAFNGTNGSEGYIKLNTGDSFKKIENLGGWTNASTNYALTDYVNSTPMLNKADLEEQLKTIAAMSEDLTLAENMITKEKGPVCSEINMILDDPQTILMDQTVRSIFNIKSSADELVGGSVKHIQNLDRQKVKDYYDKYYTPDNMNLVITGNINPDETIELVSKLFKSTKKRQGQIYEEKLVPINKTIRKDFITDKATSTNVMLGFSGPQNNDAKSKILLEIATSYLESSKSKFNKELSKINSEGVFGTEKISTNPNNPLLIYYSFDCAEQNYEQGLKIVFDRLANLKPIDNKTLENIKTRLLQDMSNSLEYSLVVNNTVGNVIFDNDMDYIENYENILNEITTDDVKKFINEYINLNKTAITVVHPKTSSLSFKRRPVNMDKVSSQKLDNNYKIAFQETKNNNVYFNIALKNENINNNPALKAVLDQIYQINIEENLGFFEDNNINITADLYTDKLVIGGYSSSKDFKKTLEKTKELLSNPVINQKYLNTAILRIIDNIARSKDTADSVYIENEAKINPLYSSKESIINNLGNITPEKTKSLHREILNNSSGFIVMNYPEDNKDTKNIAIEEFNKFTPVKEYLAGLDDVYKANTSPIVLTKENPVSQANISQTYKFKLDNSSKEFALGGILKTILTSAEEVGVFNTLREKEHLAYRVYADLGKIGNCGEFSLNIYTTTDNKEIGEISYDNLQKSINGFNRQIGLLLDSKYTDSDLESAKNILKASLLSKEGVPSKLNALYRGMQTSEGLEYENNIFNIIDSITRDDLDSFAKKVFENPPIYSIVASKDTLEANKEYLSKIL